VVVQEAVALALESDMEEAIRLVNRPQEDENLQRKLWLSIAHHLIDGAAETPDGKPVTPPSPPPLHTQSQTDFSHLYDLGLRSARISFHVLK